MNLLTSTTTYTSIMPQPFRSGITIKGIAAAFTSQHARNWHPLTTISHMLDCQLYGLNAGGHHATNVILHTIAVLLLFWVLQQMTGALWKSALVAALFAVHPLHVESVAWVSERKDVLSAVFFFLMLHAYSPLCTRTVCNALSGGRCPLRSGAHVQANAGKRSHHPSPSRLLAATPF